MTTESRALSRSLSDYKETHTVGETRATGVVQASKPHSVLHFSPINSLSVYLRLCGGEKSNGRAKEAQFEVRREAHLEFWRRRDGVLPCSSAKSNGVDVGPSGKGGGGGSGGGGVCGDDSCRIAQQREQS